MAFDSDARIQLLLSLLSWAVMVGLYLLTKRCSTASGDVTFRGGAE